MRISMPIAKQIDRLELEIDRLRLLHASGTDYEVMIPPSVLSEAEQLKAIDGIVSLLNPTRTRALVQFMIEVREACMRAGYDDDTLPIPIFILRLACHQRMH